MLENKLVGGLDIDLSTYNLGVISQPKVRDLMELPFSESELTLPFLMIERYYHDISEIEEVDFDYTRLDLIPLLETISEENRIMESQKEIGFGFNDPFIQNKKTYSFSYLLFTLIAMLYKVKVEELEVLPNEQSFSIVVKDKVIIDSQNFDILIKIIFKLFNIDPTLITKTDDDWKELSGSEKERQMIEKFKEKERKRREKEQLHLCDFVTFIVVRDGRRFEEILDWSYFQLIHIYKTGIYFHKTEVEESLLCSGNTTMTGKDISNWQLEAKMEIDNSFYL